MNGKYLEVLKVSFPSFKGKTIFFKLMEKIQKATL